MRNGAFATGTAYDRRAASEELALAPHRILLTALESSGLHLDADTTLSTGHYHRVSFPLDSGYVQLFVDATTWFPARVRFAREYSDLVFWAMWGRVTMETVWTSWSLEPTGIWYPRQRDVSFNGHPFHAYIVTRLDLAPAAVDSFAIPDSVTLRFTREAGAPRGPPPELRPVTLADGIVLFQGGYQSALVRVPSGVVVIEAPESDAKSRAVLAQANRLFPHVPIAAVVSTSPQWMHIGGLVEYARRGIPIYVLDVNGPEVRTLLTAPRQRPLPASALTPRLTLIRRRTVLGSGDNRMELLPARGTHGVAMLFVYWPAHRLLYASDMTIPPSFEPTFTAAYEAELHRVVDRLRLSVLTVYSLHLAPTPWAPSADSATTVPRPGTS